MRNIKVPSLLHHKAVIALKDQRLQPPLDMPEAQACVWRMTVSNLPPDWFAAEQIPILTAYCRHVCRSDQIELALAGLDPLQDLEEFDKLTKLAAGESAKIAMHSRAMRLTQQARFKAETAHGRGWAAAGAARIGDWNDGDGLLA